MHRATRRALLSACVLIAAGFSAVGQEPTAWFDPQGVPSQFVGGQSSNTSLTVDAALQPQPLGAQLAALGQRIDALEHPAIKYPANIQASGVFQADGGLFNQNDANKQQFAAGGVGQEIQNGADFRRARLGVRAALANNMNAFMQFDFGFPGRPTFTDVWVEWTDLPVV